MLINLLLTLHIAAGFISLVAAFLAVTSKLVAINHVWHKRSGITFFIGMTVIFLTAFPIAIIKSNHFLLLISIFSFYLAFAGWRYATNRTGIARKIDWISVAVMFISSIIMIAFGIFMLTNDNSDGITLIVFAVIGALVGLRDYRMLKKGNLKGKERIAMHLTMMLAASIATITAFVVTNFNYSPAFVLWLAPTIVITPLIIWYNFKILR